MPCVYLGSLLVVTDSYIRRYAAEALGEIGDQRAVDPLIAAPTDTNEYVRSNAARGLGKIGTPEALVAVSDYETKK